MNAAWKVAGVEKTFKRLMIDEKVAAIGTWSAIRAEIEDLTAFSLITVERGGIEIFGGRIERPGIDFSRRGSEIRPSGFDYTIQLTDYLTPQASINDLTTDAALAILLENTPYIGAYLDIIDTFSYITDPMVYETSLEFLQFDFLDACIEFDPDDPPEIEDVTRVGAITSMGFTEGRTCFFYDGDTRRFYVWYVEGGVLFYDHSVDGDTWIRRNSGVTPGGDRWSVAWFNSKVWLFEYDGVNTDFWRGTIADGTGIIAWDGGFNPVNDIFAGQIKAGPVFDDDGHIWIIRDSANGIAYESINNGAAWNPIFTASANTIIWGILPVGTDGDMYTFVENTATDDLEEWQWTLGAHTFQVIIHDMPAGVFIINLDCASNADYTPNVAWHDDDDNFDWAWKPNGGWALITLEAGVIWYLAGNINMMLGCDGGLCAYPAMIGNFGFRIYKIKNGALVSTTTTPGTIAQPENIQCPRSSLQDGKTAVFLQYEWAAQHDNKFMLWHPTGIRLNKGETTGWVRTDSIDAADPPNFIKWGYCAAEGIQLVDTDWSVRLPADNSLLGTGGQKVAFDIDIASGGTAETSIKILVDFTDTGEDPYVSEISVSENIDEVTFELDFEDVYTGMKKWAALAGAEFWIDSAGVLHVAYARGSDKSNLVVLKNSKTSDYPEIEPNIKVVSRNPDWAPYANAIYVIGAAGTPRIEADVKNQPSIDVYGEHWYCHRDPDIQSVPMAYTVGAIELARRNTVIDRIRAVILDEYDPKDIEIGDVVWVVAEFGDDVATKLNAAMRVVSLNRSWGTGGEQVSLELINLIAATEYWAHLVTVSDLTRWVTA